jgi:xanthine dehydrogenase YagS FAD-binding subunit
VALTALDAILSISSPQGDKFVRLSSFLVSPTQPGGAIGRENRLEADMMIHAIWIPSPGPGERSLYRKVKQKQSFDWPLADVAISARRKLTGNKELEAVRIILGAVAPVPHRARSAEALLLQSPSLDAERLRKIGQAALTGAIPLSAQWLQAAAGFGSSAAGHCRASFVTQGSDSYGWRAGGGQADRSDLV